MDNMAMRSSKGDLSELCNEKSYGGEMSFWQPFRSRPYSRRVHFLAIKELYGLDYPPSKTCLKEMRA